MLIPHILLIGPSERQIDFWDKTLFGYKEIVSTHIRFPSDLDGYRDQYYCFVGEWESMPWLDEIKLRLSIYGCKELQLVYEDENAI